MENQPQNIPIKTWHLFPILDKLLIELLKSLKPEEWHLPTIAKLWTVKDITAHLLDGNLRTLSFSRDRYFGETPPAVNNYQDLVTYLNQLNATWVNATKRVSPQIIIDLLEITGKQYIEHLESLNPFDTAIFSVAWAGQSTSWNWFHIAREYTEKFIHQQQIRDAVNKQALFTKELFYPFIDTFMYGLPHTYRTVDAEIGTLVRVIINTNIGGEWSIVKTETDWRLTQANDLSAISTVFVDPDIAWKLFSKGISPEEASGKVDIIGDVALGKVALQMVSVMA